MNSGSRPPSHAPTDSRWQYLRCDQLRSNTAADSAGVVLPFGGVIRKLGDRSDGGYGVAFTSCDGRVYAFSTGLSATVPTNPCGGSAVGAWTRNKRGHALPRPQPKKSRAQCRPVKRADARVRRRGQPAFPETAP
jgi:hypothetical protein